MRTYRVVDLRQESQSELPIDAPTAEVAARTVLGIDVVRGGKNRPVVAKVYYDSGPGHLNVVRFYARHA